MGRIARVVAVGMPHHITQRGNNRRDIFNSDADRALYLELLREYCQHYGLMIEAYCLMTNHIHLVAVPLRDDSLAKGLGRTHNDFSRYVNIRRGESGHLWQNRFFSCPIDSYHLWQVMRYIELNPVRAGLAKSAEDWRWSTARFHLDEVADDPLVDSGRWRASWDATSWRNALDAGIQEEALLERIRDATRNGRPLGGEHFAAEIENLLRRPVRPQKRGPSAAKAGTDETARNFEVA